MVERAALEMRNSRKAIGGSNPSLSAIIFSDLSYFKNFSKPLNPRSAHYKNLVISISYYINIFFPCLIYGKIIFLNNPHEHPVGDTPKNEHKKITDLGGGFFYEFSVYL